MKSTDVKIGNLLQRPGGAIVIVDRIEPHGFSYTDIGGGAGGWNADPDGSYIEGITLTPSWLIHADFGFNEAWYHNDLFGHLEARADGTFGYVSDLGMEWLAIIDYVHKLQNFFSVLTGKELDINVPVA